MRLVFAGYGELGATVLEALAAEHSVELVLTHKTEFAGLGEPHVAELAGRLGIRTVLSERAEEPEISAAVSAVGPDAMVSTNWRTRMPVAVIRLPRLGCLNVHDALLPRYSGFGAVNWAIRNAETETGVTVHLMEEELDTGAVLVQQTVPIGPHDTADHVYQAVLDRYVPSVLEALTLLGAGGRGEPQPTGQRTFYHRIGLRDVRIDWSLPTRAVYDLVRAQSDPYVNAWTWWRGNRLFVKTAALPATAYCGTPGRIIGPAEDGIAVACGPLGAPEARGLVLRTVQVEGDVAVPAADLFKRGGGYVGDPPDRT